MIWFLLAIGCWWVLYRSLLDYWHWLKIKPQYCKDTFHTLLQFQKRKASLTENWVDDPDVTDLHRP